MNRKFPFFKIRGVFNLVCGYGNKVGEAIVKHKDVK